MLFPQKVKIHVKKNILLYSLLNKKLEWNFYSKLAFFRQINHWAGGYRYCRLPRECKSFADSLGSAKLLQTLGSAIFRQIDGKIKNRKRISDILTKILREI